MNELDKDSIVYKIQRSGCEAVCIGETSRSISKRLYKPKNDIRHHRTHNSLVLYADKNSHLPNWSGVEILHEGLRKRERKAMEAAYITMGRVNNHREGLVSLAKATSLPVINTPGRRRGTDQSPDELPRRPGGWVVRGVIRLLHHPVCPLSEEDNSRNVKEIKYCCFIPCFFSSPHSTHLCYRHNMSSGGVKPEINMER